MSEYEAKAIADHIEYLIIALIRQHDPGISDQHARIIKMAKQELCEAFIAADAEP